MSFGPSASLHPSHCAALVGPARLRPRVARVRRTTPLRPAPLRPCTLTPLHPYPLTPLHPCTSAPSLPPRFIPSASLACPARLRPRVARVRWTTPLRPATSIHNPSRAEGHGNRLWQLVMISPSEVSTQLKAGYCGQPPPGARAIHAGGRFL